MTRPRISQRLEAKGVPVTLMRALSESDGSVLLSEFRVMLANLHESKFGMRDAKARMITDGFIEVRVHLTLAGAAALEKKTTPRKKPCAKSAATAVKKGTSPTAAPVDSTPLAMAWMGFR